MIQQKPDIETSINSIVKKIAKCGVAGDDKLKNYIGGKVDAEIARLVEKGNMDWTEICFGQSDADEERMQAAEAAAAEAERAAALAQEAAAREARVVGARFKGDCQSRGIKDSGLVNEYPGSSELDANTKDP